MSETVKTPTLINEAYFKLNCPVPLNYNIDDIEPFFPVAEKLWVEPVIGTPLYEELLRQVVDNDVSEVNSTLLMVVYPFLSFAIVYEALPFMMYHISEVGITKGKSENSESVSSHDVNYINNHLRTQVENMKQGLKDFLERNKQHYPLYKPENTCINDTSDFFFYEGYDGVDKYTLAKILNNMTLKNGAPNPNQKLYSTKRYSNRRV